jgi:hypothetical protein
MITDHKAITIRSTFYASSLLLCGCDYLTQKVQSLSSSNCEATHLIYVCDHLILKLNIWDSVVII